MTATSMESSQEQQLELDSKLPGFIVVSSHLSLDNITIPYGKE